MVDDGLAVTNAAEGRRVDRQPLGIGNGNAAMTIDTSAALGTIHAGPRVGGEFADVDLGVAPMPGPSGKGGVLVGGAALYIVNKSSPEKQAAAWEFAKFLNEPEKQADVGGRHRLRPDPRVGGRARRHPAALGEMPEFKVAYDQLVAGVNNVATAGPVIGDYQGVRDVLRDAENSMFAEGVKPKAALKAAKRDADAKIQEYNARVGVG